MDYYKISKDNFSVTQKYATEQEAQTVVAEVQPEPVVEEAVKAPAKKTSKRARKK